MMEVKHALNCAYRDQVKQDHENCSCDCHNKMVLVEPQSRTGFFSKLFYWTICGLGITLFSTNYDKLNSANVLGVAMMVFGLLFGILSIEKVHRLIKD